MNLSVSHCKRESKLESVLRSENKVEMKEFSLLLLCAHFRVDKIHNTTVANGIEMVL